MKKFSMLAFFALIAFCNNALGQEKTNILIVYHSVTGHTQAMAEAVASGARSLNLAEVKCVSVEDAEISDILAADAIIVGSPVYNANVAPAVQEFINRWPFAGEPLRDKLGAAFVSAGGMSAGEELTQMSILHSMLIFGMIVVGGPQWNQAFGASAIVNEEPFGKSDDQNKVEPYFLEKAKKLGKRVTRLTTKLHCTKE